MIAKIRVLIDIIDTTSLLVNDMDVLDGCINVSQCIVKT